MERNLYFKKPTQVWFVNLTESDIYYTGIAYRDEIICGCCGGIYKIADIFEVANEEGLTNPIVRMDWISLDNEIRGDMTPPIPVFIIPEEEFESVNPAEIFKDK
jgi:hypothetical protein